MAWLGEVPAHWEMDRLRWSVTMCKNGIWGSEPEGEDGTICVRVADFDRDRSLVNLNDPTLRLLKPSEKMDRILQRGDLLLEKSGGGEKQPVGFVVLYDHDQEAVCSNFIARIPIAPEQDSRYWSYLHRYFYFVRVNVRSIKQTTGIQNLDAYSYLCEQVPYPPFDEQTVIAAYLDRKTAQIDAVIARKERLIDLLREERTAVISHAVTKGLNPDAPMKDSGVAWLGQVPAEWEVKRLKWVIRDKLKYGANETSDLTDPSLPRYIRITDFDEDGNLRDETFRAMEWEVAKDYLLDEGDVLFARSGATVGKTFQFKNYAGYACFAGYLIKAKPEPSILYSDYLYLYTQSGAYENWRNSIFIQATIQNIGADKYSVMEIPLPPLQEQAIIIEYLDQEATKIDQTITCTEGQIERLREYRTALISAVVTGKVDVREEVEE